MTTAFAGYPSTSNQVPPADLEAIKTHDGHGGNAGMADMPGMEHDAMQHGNEESDERELDNERFMGADVVERNTFEDDDDD